MDRSCEVNYVLNSRRRPVTWCAVRAGSSRAHGPCVSGLERVANDVDLNSANRLLLFFSAKVGRLVGWRGFFFLCALYKCDHPERSVLSRAVVRRSPTSSLDVIKGYPFALAGLSAATCMRSGVPLRCASLPSSTLYAARALQPEFLEKKPRSPRSFDSRVYSVAGRVSNRREDRNSLHRTCFCCDRGVLSNVNVRSLTQWSGLPRDSTCVNSELAGLL